MSLRTKRNKLANMIIVIFLLLLSTSATTSSFGFWAFNRGGAFDSFPSAAQGLFHRVPELANSTIGHPDIFLSLGIEIRRTFLSGNESVVEEEVPEPEHYIPMEELDFALNNAKRIALKTHDEILKEGWNAVHIGELFSLYKKRKILPSGQLGPVEYLMMGTFSDVSARTFLFSQIDKKCRSLWDKTMRDMSEGTIDIKKLDAGGGTEAAQEDMLYYRTKWPWPLKDRDYTLARRCRKYKDSNSIVLVSKSKDTDEYPLDDGVIRVDNYWCHSVFMSTTSDTTLTPSKIIDTIPQDCIENDVFLPMDEATTNDAVESSPAISDPSATLLPYHRLPFSPQDFHKYKMCVRNNRKHDKKDFHSYYMKRYWRQQQLEQGKLLDKYISFLQQQLPAPESTTFLSEEVGDYPTTTHSGGELMALSNLFRTNKLGMNVPRASEIQRENRPRGIRFVFGAISSGVRSLSPFRAGRDNKALLQRLHQRVKSELGRIPGTGGKKRAHAEYKKQQDKEKNTVKEVINASLLPGNWQHSSHDPRQVRPLASSSSDVIGGDDCESIAENESVENPELSNKYELDRTIRPGMKFVTIFCDDQKVPLPPKLLDYLSKQAEKVVPGSLDCLHEVAKKVESDLFQD